MHFCVQRFGTVAYKLDLPTSMKAFHKVYHVSLVKKCIRDNDNVMTEPPSDLRENLTIEGRPVRIMDRKVKPERRKKVKMIQVVWDCDGDEDVTWKPEVRMKAKFPKWFDKLKEDACKEKKIR